MDPRLNALFESYEATVEGDTRSADKKWRDKVIGFLTLLRVWVCRFFFSRG